MLMLCLHSNLASLQLGWDLHEKRFFPTPIKDSFLEMGTKGQSGISQQSCLFRLLFQSKNVCSQRGTLL